jgi:hypothetical protein
MALNKVKQGGHKIDCQIHPKFSKQLVEKGQEIGG